MNITGKVSNELTFLYKYILPLIGIIALTFFLGLIISYKIYLFMVIILIFIVFFFFQIKLLLKLSEVVFENDYIIIQNRKNKIELKWSDIENVKRIKYSAYIIKIESVLKESYYFMPKTEYYVLYKANKLLAFMNSKIQ